MDTLKLWVCHHCTVGVITHALAGREIRKLRAVSNSKVVDTHCGHCGRKTPYYLVPDQAHRLLGFKAASALIAKLAASA